MKQRDEKGNVTILTAPEEAWNWQAGGPMLTRPLPAETVVVFGSSDGKVYVVMANERTHALPVFNRQGDRCRPGRLWHCAPC